MDGIRRTAIARARESEPRRIPDGALDGLERRAKPEAKPVALTYSERRVVAMVGNGMKSREIADALGVSVRTVESHRYRVKKKIGPVVDGVVRGVAFDMAHGLFMEFLRFLGVDGLVVLEGGTTFGRQERMEL